MIKDAAIIVLSCESVCEAPLPSCEAANFKASEKILERGEALRNTAFLLRS